jgi:hypothetical protein
VRSTVTKRYVGPVANERWRVERMCINGLSGLVPVPRLLADSDRELTMSFVDGHHGQDLIDEGLAAMVLHVCGELLTTFQSVPVDAVLGCLVREPCWSMANFGAQNLLVDPSRSRATALKAS